MNDRSLHTSSYVFLILVAGIALPGCSTTEESGRVTLAQIQALQNFESLLPVGTDSVVELYQRNDPAQFRTTYRRQLVDASRYVDSLNALLDVRSRIDTLAIDHAIDNFGTAASSGKTLYISSSYFLLYPDSTIIHSVILHEFGHLIYNRLSGSQQEQFKEVWSQLSSAALLYLFRDGEYSGNARFGGHPYDSPSELFASAFNLLHTRENELDSRLRYVAPGHLALIARLRRMVFTFAGQK